MNLPFIQNFKNVAEFSSGKNPKLRDNQAMHLGYFSLKLSKYSLKNEHTAYFKILIEEGIWECKYGWTKAKSSFLMTFVVSSSCLFSTFMEERGHMIGFQLPYSISFWERGKHFSMKNSFTYQFWFVRQLGPRPWSGGCSIPRPGVFQRYPIPMVTQHFWFLSSCWHQCLRHDQK